VWLLLLLVLLAAGCSLLLFSLAGSPWSCLLAGRLAGADSAAAECVCLVVLLLLTGRRARCLSATAFEASPAETETTK